MKLKLATSSHHVYFKITLSRLLSVTGEEQQYCRVKNKQTWISPDTTVFCERRKRKNKFWSFVFFLGFLSGFMNIYSLRTSQIIIYLESVSHTEYKPVCYVSVLKFDCYCLNCVSYSLLQLQLPTELKRVTKKQVKL